MNKIVQFLFINLLLLLHLQPLTAQDSAGNILHWEFSASKKSDSDYTLNIRGKIQKGWRLFSTTMRDDLPNSRVELDSSTFAKIKNIEEKGNLQIRKEPVLDLAEIRYFENQVDIQVAIRVVNHQKDIQGQVSFMAIKNDSVIGPQTVPFRFFFDAAGNLIAGVRV
jgi:hypothetical protein